MGWQVLAFLLLAPAIPSLAQTHYGDFVELFLTTKDSQDVRYVESFKLKWSPRLYLQSRSVSFGFRSKGIIGQRRQYSPNVSAAIGVGLYYESFGGSYSFSFGQNDTRDKNLGQTRYLDFGVNSYQRRFVVDASFQRYQGFYISKDDGPISRPNVDRAYPQRSDIIYQNLGLGYIYIVNHTRFSLQAGMWQSRRQVRSAGSVLWMEALSYTTIKGDSGILAKRTRSEGHTTDSLKFNKGHFLMANILPGYGHTFVYKHLYLLAAGFFGPTMQLQNYKVEEYKENGSVKTKSTENKIAIGTRLNMRGAVGYNGDKWFLALIGMLDANQSIVEGIRLQNQSVSLTLQGGFRF